MNPVETLFMSPAFAEARRHLTRSQVEALLTEARMLSQVSQHNLDWGNCAIDDLKAAKAEIERLTAERDEALAKVKAMQEDLPYVIGFNAGWDEAISQNFRFPTMLRKMWSGGEVQNWINEQFAAALKGGGA